MAMFGKPGPLHFVALASFLACLYFAQSASGFADCVNVEALLRRAPDCRWPAYAHYGFKLSLLVGLTAILLGVRQQRRRRGDT